MQKIISKGGVEFLIHIPTLHKVCTRVCSERYDRITQQQMSKQMQTLKRTFQFTLARKKSFDPNLLSISLQKI